jgi:hypothetical protein
MFRRYIAIVASVTALMLGVIATTNTIVALSPFIYGSPAVRAAAWQRESGGVAAVAPSEEYEFKSIVFAERASTLRTMVVGSSRVMTLGSTVTGPNSYNSAISSNALALAISQGRHALTIAPHLQTIYVSIDWAIGDVFYALPIPQHFIVQQQAIAAHDIITALKDSIALPRVAGLLGPLISDLLSGRIPEVLYALSGKARPTKCVDGSISANFGFPLGTICPGFRSDGAPLFHLRGVVKDDASARGFIRIATAPQAQIVKALAMTYGRPNATYLTAVSDINERLRQRGGNVIAVIPPLIPGLKRALSDLPEAGSELRAFDATIALWSAQANIVLIDAAASEDYGCVPQDFIDAHHATESCWMKIFRRHLTTRG